MSDSHLERQHLELLLSASALFHSDQSLDEVLTSLVRQARDIVGAQNSCILLLDNGELGVKTAINEVEQEPYFSRTVVDKVLNSGKTLCLVDAVQEESFQNTMSIQMSGVRSIICAPLKWQDQVRGVIYLDNRISQGVFKEAQTRLIEALSQQAAAALDRVALYEERERMHEQALRQARAELAETQSQLFSASKLAAVGELAAGLAHELNNPLCAIAVNLGSVERRVQDPKLKRRVDIMSQGVQRCRHVVDKLLTFTHPSRVEWTTCDLRELLKQSMDLMSFQLREVSLETDLQPVQIKGEPAPLGQVILNLLGNACYAVEANEGMRAVRVECGRDERGPYFLVGDNGHGMSEEVKERVLEPFFTTKPVGSGTGLGLSVSYQILKNHQARLLIKSKKGMGSTFLVLFPEVSDEGSNTDH